MEPRTGCRLLRVSLRTHCQPRATSPSRAPQSDAQKPLSSWESQIQKDLGRARFKNPFSVVSTTVTEHAHSNTVGTGRAGRRNRGTQFRLTAHREQILDTWALSRIKDVT